MASISRDAVDAGIGLQVQKCLYFSDTLYAPCMSTPLDNSEADEFISQKIAKTYNSINKQKRRYILGN